MSRVDFLGSISFRVNVLADSYLGGLALGNVSVASQGTKRSSLLSRRIQKSEPTLNLRCRWNEHTTATHVSQSYDSGSLHPNIFEPEAGAVDCELTFKNRNDPGNGESWWSYLHSAERETLGVRKRKSETVKEITRRTEEFHGPFSGGTWTTGKIGLTHPREERSVQQVEVRDRTWPDAVVGESYVVAPRNVIARKPTGNGTKLVVEKLPMPLLLSRVDLAARHLAAKGAKSRDWRIRDCRAQEGAEIVPFNNRNDSEDSAGGEWEGRL
ncbi:hypothetical protein FB451DRAFT_1178523 [Mycena latifolia]|nr:hypothetical protein FB451DRAFT_1178523 [Mycena latifolia]